MTKRSLQQYRVLKQTEQDLWGKFKVVDYKSKTGDHKKRKFSFKNKRYLTIPKHIVLPTYKKVENKQLLESTSSDSKKVTSLTSKNSKVSLTLNKSSKQNRFRKPNKSKNISNFSDNQSFYQINKFYCNLSNKRIREMRANINDIDNKYMYSKNEKVLSLIERRIDSILYRSHFAKSFQHSRQLINHGLVYINGKITKRPAKLLSIGDIVQMSSTYTKNSKLYIEQFLNRKAPSINIPSHLECNLNLFMVTLVENPSIRTIPYPTISIK